MPLDKGAGRSYIRLSFAAWRPPPTVRFRALHIGQRAMPSTPGTGFPVFPGTLLTWVVVGAYKRRPLGGWGG
jgi:hypothetical protein